MNKLPGVDKFLFDCEIFNYSSNYINRFLAIQVNFGRRFAAVKICNFDVFVHKNLLCKTICREISSATFLRGLFANKLLVRLQAPNPQTKTFNLENW